MYDHGRCWGSYDVPLEISPESLEQSLENLTRKHQERIERQEAGEALSEDEYEKLKTRPPLIAQYRQRIADWNPGELEQRTVQVKKRKQAAPTVKMTCCMCGRTTKLKKDGNVQQHTYNKTFDCPGSHQPPIEISVEQCSALRSVIANQIATARLFITSVHPKTLSD